MKAAEKQFDQAAGQMARGQAPKSDVQSNGAMPLSEAQKGIQPPSSVNTGPADPDNTNLHGSPSTGYAGTWKDPATGDIITSVIAPQPAQAQSQDYPIIVSPQVGSWGSSYSGDWDSGNWNPGNWNPGWQGGYQGPWQGYPGNNGYPPPPPPGWNGLPPNSGIGGPTTWPGYLPTHPVYPHPPFPPNGYNPHYRPLKPGPPQHAFPGGPRPPQNGFPGANPPPPPSGFPGGVKPPQNGFPGPNPPPPSPGNNGSLWRPGGNLWHGPGSATPPPPANGFQPGPAPGVRPLPMAPAGQTWKPPMGGPRPPMGGFGGPGSRGGF